MKSEFSLIVIIFGIFGSRREEVSWRNSLPVQARHVHRLLHQCNSVQCHDLLYMNSRSDILFDQPLCFGEMNGPVGSFRPHMLKDLLHSDDTGYQQWQSNFSLPGLIYYPCRRASHWSDRGLPLILIVGSLRHIPHSLSHPHLRKK